ncbi:3b0a0453-9298-4dd1-b32b-20c65a51ce29 [Thermothielavioides terrestris]|jgi:hypothetical protein
MVNL